LLDFPFHCAVPRPGQRAIAQAPRDDAVRHGVAVVFGELSALLIGQMHEMQASGFLSAWIDPSAMATLLLAMGEGVALHSVVDPATVNAPAIAGQMIQLLLSARADPSGPVPPGPGTRIAARPAPGYEST
jgi:hypothetical protein